MTMPKYKCTKVVHARPMGRIDAEQCDLVRDCKHVSEAGYVVRYADGYESWSPAKAFEDGYKLLSERDMTFGEALEHLKDGKKLTRTGWNGRRSDGSPMYVFMVSGSKFIVNRAPLNEMFSEGTEINYKPHIDMCHADDSIGVWVAVTNDILAEDWEIVT